MTNRERGLFSSVVLLFLRITRRRLQDYNTGYSFGTSVKGEHGRVQVVAKREVLGKTTVRLVLGARSLGKVWSKKRKTARRAQGE